MKSFKEAIKTSTVVKLPDQITVNIKQNFFNVIALEEKELCLCPNMQYLKLGAACCITDFPMAQHVALSPPGMNQCRGQTEQKAKRKTKNH